MVKLSAIGDVVHTLPSLAVLHRLYPQANITWVVEEAAADLLTGHPYLHRVLISRRKKWLKELRKGRVGSVGRELSAFLGALRDRTYDLVIDFHGLFKSSLIVLLSGGKRRVGYDSWQELSFLALNERVPEDMNKHAVDRYLDLVYHLGAQPTPMREFLIPHEQEAERRVDALLKARGISRGEPFVVLNPLALWETKLWNNDGFVHICDDLFTKLRLKSVLVGIEHKSLRYIAARTKSPVIDLIGQTTLKELVCLLKKAKLMVTTDSGPMHIAAAVDTPIVALFGPTDPRRTGPYGDGHLVIQKNLPCSPCFLKRCKTRECMLDITAEEVFHSIERFLEERI